MPTPPREVVVAGGVVRLEAANHEVGECEERREGAQKEDATR